MIKDIIVNLSVTKEGSVVGKYAVSVAAALEAHLTGVAFIYDPVVPISGAGYIPAEVIETQRDDNEAAAEAAIKSFTAAANQAGVSAESLTTSASLAGAGDHFARMARRFDLAIVGQAQPEVSSMEQVIGETTLFESGRPMIGMASATAAASKSSSSPTNAASRTKSRAPISVSIWPATDLKWMSIAFPAATSMSAMRYCRTPPTAAPISWSWAATVIRDCVNSCSAERPGRFSSQ